MVIVAGGLGKAGLITTTLLAAAEHEYICDVFATVKGFFCSLNIVLSISNRRVALPAKRRCNLQTHDHKAIS